MSSSNKAKELSNWCLLKYKGLEGDVNNGMFEERIRTSQIVDFKNGVFTTATGSRYTLGTVEGSYDKLFPNALWRTWDSFNQQFNNGKVYPPEQDDPDFDYKSLWWLHWIQRLPKSDRRRQLAESLKDDWQVYHPSIRDWVNGNACDAIDGLAFYGWPVRLGEMDMTPDEVFTLKRSAELCLPHYRSLAPPFS